MVISNYLFNFTGVNALAHDVGPVFKAAAALAMASCEDWLIAKVRSSISRSWDSTSVWRILYLARFQHPVKSRTRKRATKKMKNDIHVTVI